MPKTTLKEIDFMTLESLRFLPSLRKIRDDHEVLAQEVKTAEAEVTDAIERYRLAFIAYEVRTGIRFDLLTGKPVLEGTMPEPVQVAQQARVQAEMDLAAKREEVATSRYKVDAAVELAREAIQPAIVAQLGPPVEGVLEGLEAALAADRLLGAATAWQMPAERRTVQQMVAFLRHCRELLA